MVTAFGDPAAIAGAADGLSAAATAAESAADSARNARAPEWSGAASDAYAISLAAVIDDVAALPRAYRAAASTLHTYADTLRGATTRRDDAEKRFYRAQDAIIANPLDFGAWQRGVQAEIDYIQVVGEVQDAASRAAAELRVVFTGGDDADGDSWWDPFGWFTGDDDGGPDQDVPDDILDDDAFDGDDVSQGGIGDCFMLSNIVALLGSDGGDAFIREHVRWDDDREGYWVTIYRNGEPVDVFVDKVFGDGARQDDWSWLFLSGDKPSIAALYEAAIAEEYGESYLDGGVAADAMGVITGRDVTEIENSSYAGLTADQLAPVRETLEQGGQAVISSPRSGDPTITVQRLDDAGNLVDDEVDIVTQHAYAITRIEDDGSVWMRNPWGPGNSADGGGEFRVDAADVSDLFWRVAATNVTAP